MENSENQDNEDTEHKVLPIRNLSDSDLQLKRLSVNPNDADNNLHMIGFKIQLNDNQEYFFSLDKAGSEWADILKNPADSNESTGQQVTEFHQTENEAIKDSPSSGNENEEKLKNSSALQLTFGSNGLEKEEFKVHITSKNDSSVKEQQCLSKTYREKVSGVAKFSSDGDGSHPVRYLKESSTDSLKHIPKMTATAFDIEKESAVTSFQIENAAIVSSKNLKTVYIQTENAYNVSTESQGKMAELVEIETDHVSIKQAATQTEKEIVSMSSQTEKVAIFSTEERCDVSTQIGQTHSVATSTDFSIYVVDRENISKKSADTEDFPLTSPVKAKEKETKKEENQTDDSCQCSCGHKMQHDCIYKCCYHWDSENVIPTNILFGQNLQYLGSTYTAFKCDYCRCRLNRNCSETKNNCAEKFKSDIHPQFCCKCAMNVKSVKDSSTSMVEAENPKSIELRNDDDSLGLKGGISQQPQLEIVKSLEPIKEKEETSVALKVFKFPKIEKVSSLQKPTVFELCLSISSLSKLDESKIEINPVAITLNGKVVSGNLPEESNITSLTDRNPKDQDRNSHQAIFSEIEKESPKNNCNESLNLASYYSRSQLCPCSMCHSNAETVQATESYVHPRKHPNVLDKEKNKSSKKQFRSTSPKIKSEDFDYMSKDGWKPYNYKSDEFLNRKTTATDIIHIEKTSDEECFESFIEGLKDACVIVNDHLLNLRPVDEATVKKAAELLHKQWFEIVGSKFSDKLEVRHYIQYFKSFSNNLVKTLLHSVDSNGNNVLHFAFANSRFDLVDELLQNGFALELINKGNKSGNTPLMICSISQPISHSEWTVVRKCFEFSDVNQKSAKNGQTPLMNAASSGFQAMVDLLLDIGANPNLQDKDGSTALMYAAEHGHEKCIKSLMRHKKCDPTIRDKDGETACSIALSNGHKNAAVLIHMQALEKRRHSKNLYSTKRFIWKSRNKTARKIFNYGA